VNSARPAAGVQLCALSEIADPGAKGFAFRQGEALFMGFVVRRDGEVFGYIDRCPHAGSPLEGFDGRYLTRSGDLILCSAHAALFRLGDGVCVAGPSAGMRLAPWPVMIAEDAVVCA
jgi:nitrite reductase/ring-hydroxylating ferredoxin subunit